MIRCWQSFSCMNPNETVHFKFDRFDTENSYDYFVIGNPYDFDYLFENHFDEVENDYRDETSNRVGLMLDGSRQTGIWVTAESIKNFDIYFYRNVFRMLYSNLIKNLLKSFESDIEVTKSGVRLLLECRAPLPSTPDAFDIYSPTIAPTTTTEPSQYMLLTGSITTAYSFSIDLIDPESDLFKEYASTLQSEMISIILRSSMIESVYLQVTGFSAVSVARKRRQASETKAMAVFQALAEPSEDAVLEDVEGAVENEIKSAADEELGSLDADSFNIIGAVVGTITTVPTTCPTTVPTTCPTTVPMTCPACPPTVATTCPTTVPTTCPTTVPTTCPACPTTVATTCPACPTTVPTTCPTTVPITCPTTVPTTCPACPTIVQTTCPVCSTDCESQSVESCTGGTCPKDANRTWIGAGEIQTKINYSILTILVVLACSGILI